METKHTAGPWLIDHGTTRMEIHEADGKIVCVVPRDDKYGRPYHETLAITRVMAAAQFMYAALLEIAEMCEGFDGCPVGPKTIADKARAAISKAEGR